ncbi:MAG: tRNA (cytidine(34)-2'-O)-methyltransferase [Verrucomicrobiae bacterium]|nr:tRNA (cytidine(34)-2'-O)-methyltransferase [Verrucomicrobiae bacterium]
MIPPPFHVVLYEPEIPPNTGNVMRLCAATRTVLHLIEPLGFRLDDRGMKRAAMDYAGDVDMHVWKNWAHFLEEQKPGRLFFIETGSGQSYTTAPFAAGDCLVFGRESRGLPPSMLAQNAGRCYEIPIINPNARSLNLSNCVAIVLYEALRQAGGGRHSHTP